MKNPEVHDETEAGIWKLETGGIALEEDGVRQRARFSLCPAYPSRVEIHSGVIPGMGEVVDTPRARTLPATDLQNTARH